MGWAPEKIQTKKRRSEFGSHQAAAPGWALGKRMSLRGERRPVPLEGPGLGLHVPALELSSLLPES